MVQNSINYVLMREFSQIIPMYTIYTWIDNLAIIIFVNVIKTDTHYSWETCYMNLKRCTMCVHRHGLVNVLQCPWN